VKVLCSTYGGEGPVMTKVVFLTALVGLLVASCAIAKPTYLADGRQGFSISCDGAAVGINVCFEKAGDLCKGRGYDLVSREGQIIPMGVGTASGNAGAMSANFNAYVYQGAFYTKSIMVACR
jgi:hypothetical protein